MSKHIIQVYMKHDELKDKTDEPGQGRCLGETETISQKLLRTKLETANKDGVCPRCFVNTGGRNKIAPGGFCEICGSRGEITEKEASRNYV